jgi:hypothetical protein
MKTSHNPSNPNFKITYPGLSAYHFPTTPQHLSPCLDPFFRTQPIRQGKQRDEHDFEDKEDNEFEEEEGKRKTV